MRLGLSFLRPTGLQSRSRSRSIETLDRDRRAGRFLPFVFDVQAARAADLFKLCGGYFGGVTPVPIPNTEVKPSTADGTAWETAWESRSLPGLFIAKKAVALATAFFFVPRSRPHDYAAAAVGGTAGGTTGAPDRAPSDRRAISKV